MVLMNVKYLIITKELRYNRIKIGVVEKLCSVVGYEPYVYPSKEYAIEELSNLDIGDLSDGELVVKISQIRKHLKDVDKDILDIFNDNIRIPKDPENKESKLQNVAIDSVSGALVIRWSEIAEVFEKR